MFCIRIARLNKQSVVELLILLLGFWLNLYGRSLYASTRAYFSSRIFKKQFVIFNLVFIISNVCFLNFSCRLFGNRSNNNIIQKKHSIKNGNSLEYLDFCLLKHYQIKTYITAKHTLLTYCDIFCKFQNKS